MTRYPLLGETVGTVAGDGVVVEVSAKARYNGLYHEAHPDRDIEVVVWWGMDNIREVPGYGGRISWVFSLSELTLYPHPNHASPEAPAD